MLKRLNAKLECHMARPHALPHEVSTFIYTNLKSHVYVRVCKKPIDPPNPTHRVWSIFRVWWVRLGYKKNFLVGRVGFES